MAEGRGDLLVVAGGGALLWWLLHRGKGWRLKSAVAGGRTGQLGEWMQPCKLRLGKEGLTVNGRAANLEEAIAACKKGRRVELLVTGDAPFGQADELRRALEAAGIEPHEVHIPIKQAASGKRRGQKLSRSTVDASGTVVEPAERLLAQARRVYPDLTMDEYTAARLAASEHYSGSAEELAAIIDAEVNRAERKGKSLFTSLTWRGTFGKQGKRRRASTRLDPKQVHLAAARSILRTGEARGISQGAERFFDPRTQLALFKAGKACHPLVILERWAFDYPWASRCTVGRKRPGNHLLEWIGEAPGIDPTQLLLMRPAKAGPEHKARYQAAKQLIETRVIGGKVHA